MVGRSAPTAAEPDAAGARYAATRRLPSRIGVWPDTVQGSGGTLVMRLPTGYWVWLSSGLRPVGPRDEEWLKRGLPSS